MIFICDLCGKPDSLSHYEYVIPIKEIVKSSGIGFKTVHYTDLAENELKDADALILCGTTLMDNKFLEDMDRISFIKNLDIPVLGVCAGVQVITKLFGGKIIPNKQIGMTRVIKIRDDPLFGDNTGFEAYELHSNSFEIPKDFVILAESESGIQSIKHEKKMIYGVVFHPEVRNEWIVLNFLKIAEKSDCVV